MAKLNLSQAAKAVNKNRTTIWRHIKSGKLSADNNRDGLPFVDTSELIRVYGEIQPIATPSDKLKPHEATPNYEELIGVIELLRKEQFEMKKQIDNLTNRLSYVPLDTGEKIPQPNNPEDDPLWPAEIKSMADIILRNDIKTKYK
jgi:hypothetical protein